MNQTSMLAKASIHGAAYPVYYRLETKTQQRKGEKTMADLKDLKKIKDMVQEFVDQGATTVEQIHKSIAEMPLKTLEQVVPEEKKPLVEPVKNIHDATVGSVYELIRNINRQVGEVADDILSKAAKEE